MSAALHGESHPSESTAPFVVLQPAVASAATQQAATLLVEAMTFTGNTVTILIKSLSLV